MDTPPVDTDPEDEAAPPLPTYDLIQKLGFVPDRRDQHGRPVNLKLDFGDFEISADQGMSPRSFVEVVAFFAFRATNNGRTVHEIEFEMPVTVESREQGIAWLTWCLDQQADLDDFPPVRPMPWLPKGRAHFHLLPWERRRAEYEAEHQRRMASPHCYADREWTRLALRRLDRLVRYVNASELIVLSYDGEVLIIRCLGEVLPVPARGDPWPGRYAIRAGTWEHPRRRFKRPDVPVWIFEGALSIDTYQYPGVTPLDAEVAP